jgi:hypothetical protein
MRVWHWVAIAFVFAAVATLWIGGSAWLALLMGGIWAVIVTITIVIEDWWRYRRHGSR